MNYNAVQTSPPETWVTVVECDFPCASVLEGDFIAAAYFHDSYRAPLNRREAGVVQVFHAIFGHHPRWMKLLLLVRNQFALFCGLDAPKASDIIHFDAKSSYRIGDKIGVWPIFALTDTELVAGRDNRHLDFRLSVLKELNGTSESVVVSTVCTVHNAFGKLYLRLVVPIHRYGVRRLISNAVVAGRL